MNYEYNFQMMDETDCESVWNGDFDIIVSMWGHILFEGEYPEVRTICMHCGEGLQCCTCSPDQESLS